MKTTIQEHLRQTGKAVLFSVCLDCRKMYGIKAGNGVCGVSHGYCSDCLKKNLKRL